jgi:hypothetical protein|tara:strand:+ start:1341 stop:1739 length:399 start_codon:yes stop_codon:yes gene_type:complete
MQTFMPYPDIVKSVECLDYKRLGKQRVEAMQTYNQITKGKGGYPHHPVNKMWRDYPSALAYYHNMCIDEWIKRGYNNTMELIHFNNLVLPDWIGDERIHKSHRSNLLRKDQEFYGQYGWNEPTDIEYYWWGD